MVPIGILINGISNHRSIIRQKIGVGKPLNTLRLFIGHYLSKYSKPPLPPAWMIFEVLSFGDVSHIFQNLHKSDQTRIANYFKLPPIVLVSWMRSLSSLRNVCAHHEVLWNRKFLVNQPKVPKKLAGLVQDNVRVYGYLVMIKYFLSQISETKKWAKQIKHLVENEGLHLHHANVAKIMGFPSDWHEIELWGLSKARKLDG